MSDEEELAMVIEFPAIAREEEFPRFSVNMTEETAQKIRDLKAVWDLSATDVLARMTALAHAIEIMKAKGWEMVLVKDDDVVSMELEPEE